MKILLLFIIFVTMYLLDYINSPYLKDDSAVITKKSKTKPLLSIFVDVSNKENFNAISQELSFQVIQMGGVKK